MADAMVSLLLGRLKGPIFNKAKEEVKLLVGVEEEVKKLERNLGLIETVLADAEMKKRTDSRVKQWLEQLKEVSYDMEDALDDWRIAVESHQREVPFKSCLPCRRVGTRRRIAVTIKDINQRLDEIAQGIEKYQLVRKEIELPKRPESSSFVDLSDLCGRDGEKEWILSNLWGENSEEKTGDLIKTVSIVGVGGLGKTALAQLVYNDHDVKRHFDSVIWVCVSDLFDEKKVARAIIQGLEELNDGAAYGLESNPLQVLLGRISSSIKKKKFLLVLDDVWADEGERWNSLQVTFKNGVPGSRILVTTRDVRVANMMGSSSSQIIHLETLGDEECWQILSRVALREMDEKTCQNLEKIGRKIAKRCKGLPLAAKTLGSLLQYKKTQAEWRSVLDSQMWNLELVQKNVFVPLLLSYYDLPLPVRQCFVYCSLFPKDTVIWLHDIMAQWRAHGFLGCDGNGDLESTGLDYFHILAARSFFQDFGRWQGVIFNFKLHDLVHDFAIYLADNDFVIKEVNSDNLVVDSKHRHLTVMVDKYMPFPTSISGAEKLRTLIAFTGERALTYEALHHLFNQCRRLRTLGLDWPDGTNHLCNAIPKQIGKLMHLRYLNLSHSDQLDGLPEALSNVRNLEHLDLKGCRNLKQLPEWMTKLVNLRYLRTSGCSLTHYPKYIQKLTSLRALLGVIARADRNDAEEFSLADLANLRHLRRVWLKVVGGSIDVGQTRKARFQNLQELCIYLAGRIDRDDIIEALDPPSDIPYLQFSSDYWFN